MIAIRLVQPHKMNKGLTRKPTPRW